MFKIGDKVRCIEESDLSGGKIQYGKVGQVYKVVRIVNSYTIYIKGLNDGGVTSSRFELVEEPKESKKYIVIDQDGYSRTFDLLEAAIESAKFDGEADIYELGRKLEKKTVVTWE